MKKEKPYSYDFKKEIVESILKDHMSIKKISSRWGISIDLISDWIKAYQRGSLKISYHIKPTLILSIISILIVIIASVFTIKNTLEQNKTTEQVEFNKSAQAETANEIAQLRADVELGRSRVEFTHMFINDYIHGSEETQSLILEIFRELYPTETLEFEDILKKHAINKNVEEKVDKTRKAIQDETSGFILILDGKLTEARDYFKYAHETSPADKKIDYIYNLIENIIDRYELSTEIERKNTNKDLIKEILLRYSWSMENDVKLQYEEYIEFDKELNNLFSEEKNLRSSAYGKIKNIMLNNPREKYFTDMFIKIKEDPYNILGRSNCLSIISELDSSYVKKYEHLINQELVRIEEENYGIGEQTEGWINDIRKKFD